MLKTYTLILLGICFSFASKAYSPDACIGDWKKEGGGLINYVQIKKVGPRYLVTASKMDGNSENKTMVFSTHGKEKSGKIYIGSKINGRPFKGEVDLGSNARQLVMKLIIKDAKKGIIRTRLVFAKDAPNPAVLTSKPGFIQLWNCQECVVGSKAARGNSALPVQVFIRSKKMKKTQFGFEEPAVEMHLSFTDEKGKYARYAVPALPRGEYEVFVQYKESRNSFLEPEPLPYSTAILKAKGDWPISLSIPRN